MPVLWILACWEGEKIDGGKMKWKTMVMMFLAFLLAVLSFYSPLPEGSDLSLYGFLAMCAMVGVGLMFCIEEGEQTK
jgi:hypothetical protein